MEKNFISAVIYVHNSSERIEEFLGGVMQTLEQNFEHSEIICVNDCSDDDSVGIVKRIASKQKAVSVTVLNMSYFHGVEAAMNAGVDLAIGDFVFEFDAAMPDFDRQEIMNVYKKSLEGFDIVSASPDKGQRM